MERFFHPRLLMLLLVMASLSACLSESDDAASTNVDLAIVSPISTNAMDTTDETVTLSGTARSDMGIHRISWNNDRGPEGIADGTDAWRAEGIALLLGENKITVTAEDTAGDTESRSITVNRESGEKGSVTVTWTPPTTRADGSPLTNLAGYKIFYGRMSGVYDYEIDVEGAGISTYVVEDLVSGEWYFALAAYDSDGLESDRSNEASGDIS